MAELKEDIRPLVNQACQSLVRELRTMETRVQLEDLLLQIEDGLVVLFGLAKKLGHPRTRAFFEVLTDFPSEVDWTQCKRVGPMGLISAIRCSEVQDGLGVIMEFTKAIAKVKVLKDGATEQ
jgi:hypothetical protein